MRQTVNRCFLTEREFLPVQFAAVQRLQKKNRLWMGARRDVSIARVKKNP
jgi:hypothetical protein